MTIEMQNLGNIPYSLSPDDQFQITIDIATWLGTDEISSVAYSAVDQDGNNETSNVLDAAKHTNTNTVIKPYIKGGTDDEIYTVKCLVTTTGTDKKAFYARFACVESALVV